MKFWLSNLTKELLTKQEAHIESYKIHKQKGKLSN